MVAKGIPWEDDEFELLWICVRDALVEGRTAIDGVHDFVKAAPHRSASSARYKLVTRVMVDHREEYEAAQQQGNKIMAEKNAERYQRQSSRPVIPFRRAANNESKTFSKGELIQFLRDVEIVSDDEAELRDRIEHLEQQLAEVTKERDEFKSKCELVQGQLSEVKEERDQMVAAFNIVRKNLAGIDETQSRKGYQVNSRGEVEKVLTD